MQTNTKNKINELQLIISKMPLEVCCVTVLPEFGVRWREMSRAVRNARLPMAPASVARILCRHIGKSLPSEEIAEIVSRLRLKLVATQRRTWHVVKLSEQICDEPVNVLTSRIPNRVVQALREARNQRFMTPEVQTVKLGDLIYISIQMVSDIRQGSVLYVATPPGEPVALVSSLHSSLLRACVQGLGYKKYEDASLNGRDINSLLRIHNTNHNEHPDFLANLPEYNIMPVAVRNGIDYTGRKMDQEYASQILGPDPPQLAKLTVTAEKEFFAPEKFNMKMKLTIQLKSEDIAKTLQCWAAKGAILPTSDLFQIFHKIKSNKIHIEADDD
ncbi:uncharacterized protein LOC123666047 [Melitaea cinxia]|uniref:uncharacterized protein LOC123666047 n=1 Tax=Melitaea cinxia TaxID=113334 RepID=UPI001E27047B|nr:uncharacterized protein LOC123666047 [Melitaea cinxia]